MLSSSSSADGFNSGGNSPSGSTLTMRGGGAAASNSPHTTSRSSINNIPASTLTPKHSVAGSLSSSAPPVLVGASASTSGGPPSRSSSGGITNTHITGPTSPQSLANTPAPKRLSPTHHVLPPLPPMSLAHPSPSFAALPSGSAQASSTNLAGSYTNLAARTSSTSNLISSSSVASPSSLLHFAPRPASPASFMGLSPVHHASAGLINGMVCACPNEPGSQPCACSSGVALARSTRPASSTPTNEFNLSPNSRTSSLGATVAAGVNLPAPTVSPASHARVRPSFSMPVHQFMNSAPHSLVPSPIGGISSGCPSPSSHPLTHSSTSTSNMLAAMNMMTPDSLPTTTAIQGTALEGINMVSTGSGVMPHATPLPPLLPMPPSQPHGGAVVINIYNGLPNTGAPPAAYTVLPSSVGPRDLQQRRLSHSLFSPSAEDLRRQPSVSPNYSPVVTPTTPASEDGVIKPLLPMVAIEESIAPDDADTTAAAAAAYGVPLTESTLRVLRKALAVLKGMFPSQEDVRAEGHSGVEGSSSPLDSPRGDDTTKTLTPPPPQPTRPAHCCAPIGTECITCGPKETTVSSLCSCVTGRIFCYCGHDLHSLCTTPAWSLSSDYLRNGHRGQLTFRECVSSLFKLHTESANTWSHIFGSVWMGSHWKTSQGHWALRIQAIASATLFAISACAHTFGAISPEWNERLFRFDRCGISATETAIAISGAMVHYDRPEDEAKKKALVIFNLILGIAAQKMLMQKTPPGPDPNRLPRVLLLLTQGLIVFLPAFLHLADSKAHPTIKAMLRRYIVLVVIAGLTGSAFYATFWPESWVHAREVLATRVKAKAVQRTIEQEQQQEEIYACAHPSCCAVGPRVSPTSTTLTPPMHTHSHTRSSSADTTLALAPVSPSLRFLRWFVDHFLHSHHLMHLVVICCTHWAFMWCAKWKFAKIAMQRGYALPAVIKL